MFNLLPEGLINLSLFSFSHQCALVLSCILGFGKFKKSEVAQTETQLKDVIYCSLSFPPSVFTLSDYILFGDVFWFSETANCQVFLLTDLWAGVESISPFPINMITCWKLDYDCYDIIYRYFSNFLEYFQTFRWHAQRHFLPSISSSKEGRQINIKDYLHT